ncbi:MAG: hypothetical protein ACI3XT_05435 [Butyricicoccaceae bacterium]
MKNESLFAVLFLAAIIVSALAQTWLSSRKSRLPGLILPLLGLVSSGLFYAAFVRVFGLPAQWDATMVWELIILLLPGLLPTLVLLVIYALCRHDMKMDR